MDPKIVRYIIPKRELDTVLKVLRADAKTMSELIDKSLTFDDAAKIMEDVAIGWPRTMLVTIRMYDYKTWKFLYRIRRKAQVDLVPLFGNGRIVLTATGADVFKEYMSANTCASGPTLQKMGPLAARGRMWRSYGTRGDVHYHVYHRTSTRLEAYVG